MVEEYKGENKLVGARGDRHLCVFDACSFPHFWSQKDEWIGVEASKTKYVQGTAEIE